MPALKKKGVANGQHGVQAAETVLKVLGAFIGSEPTPMLKTLAQRTDMHPAKVHRYLVSLCRMGYVEQDRDTSRYRLGPVALRLGYAAMGTVDAIRVARPLMHEISQTVRHTVVLAIWNEGGPTIALKESAPGPIVVAATEGTTLPILRSSIGRAFGAWMPRPRTARLIAAELAQLRANPQAGVPRTAAEVDALFADIRKRGLSRVTGQLSPTLHSLAAPVYDSTADLKAVLCVVGTAHDFDSTWAGPTAKTLLAAAAKLSVALGRVETS